MNRIRIPRNVSCEGIVAAMVLSLALTLPTAHAARPSLAGLQAEIDSLHARPGPVLVVANGLAIGTLIRAPENTSHLEGDCRYQALSSRNYLFEVTYSCVDRPGQAAGQLSLEVLAFESVDCTGQAYRWSDTDDEGAANLSQGLVFDAGDGKRYYQPTGTAAVVKFTRSTYGAVGCTGNGNSSIVQPVFLNDPAVTGVSNANYPAPIQLEQ